MYRYYRLVIVGGKLMKTTIRDREKRVNYKQRNIIMAFDDLMKDRAEFLNEIKEIIEILEKKYRIYQNKGQMKRIKMHRISDYKV